VGGNNCCGTPTPAGPRDQRTIEGRQDVLIYTSDVLQDEIEVTGPSRWCSTPLPMRSIPTSSPGSWTSIRTERPTTWRRGMLRARYRESLSRPSPLQPGKVYRFEIDLVGTSVAFLKGHRMRVHVTSSHFPQFDRNPNTRCEIRHDRGGPRRPANGLSRRRPCLAHPAAGDPTRKR
jgi:putative CocE/NonD family hydrolase